MQLKENTRYHHLCDQLIQAFLSSHVEYCKSVLDGIIIITLVHWLHSVQNLATRLMMWRGWRDHINTSHPFSRIYVGCPFDSLLTSSLATVMLKRSGSGCMLDECQLAPDANSWLQSLATLACHGADQDSAGWQVTQCRWPVCVELVAAPSVLDGWLYTIYAVVKNISYWLDFDFFSF